MLLDRATRVLSGVAGRLTQAGERLGCARMKYNITLVESDEGWAVWCDGLPGCCSQGATREEALANIRVAIAEYQEARRIKERDG